MLQKLMLAPTVICLIAAILMGAAEPYGEPVGDCGDQCFDIMLARQDEVACTGGFTDDPLWGEALEKCRAKLRQEGKPVAGDGS